MQLRVIINSQIFLETQKLFITKLINFGMYDLMFMLFMHCCLALNLPCFFYFLEDTGIC